VPRCAGQGINHGGKVPRDVRQHRVSNAISGVALIPIGRIVHKYHTLLQHTLAQRQGAQWQKGPTKHHAPLQAEISHGGQPGYARTTGQRQKHGLRLIVSVLTQQNNLGRTKARRIGQRVVPNVPGLGLQTGAWFVCHMHRQDTQRHTKARTQRLAHRSEL
jgi:hypothetical protein